MNPKKDDETPWGEVAVTYEEVSELGKDFEEAELEIVRQAAISQAPLYKKRAEMVAKIPYFWSMVLEQAPSEVEHFIQPSDSEVLAAALKSIEVIRFEVEPHVSAADAAHGHTRSLLLRFEFQANAWFTNTVLEKKFWYRRCNKTAGRSQGQVGWTGLVSEPVLIGWKKGMDLTDGLTDAAYAAWKAEGTTTTTTSVGPDPKLELEHKLARLSEGSFSFFNFFGFRGRAVSALESAEAFKEEADRRAAIKAAGGGGQPVGPAVVDVDQLDEGRQRDAADAEIWARREIFPSGEEVAVLIAEELFPNALTYYFQAQEEPDSDVDFEEADASLRHFDPDFDKVDLREIMTSMEGDQADETTTTMPTTLSQVDPAFDSAELHAIAEEVEQEYQAAEAARAMARKQPDQPKEMTTTATTLPYPGSASAEMRAIVDKYAREYEAVEGEHMARRQRDLAKAATTTPQAKFRPKRIGTKEGEAASEPDKGQTSPSKEKRGSQEGEEEGEGGEGNPAKKQRKG
ncbi:MAG: hypothetical protein M1826_000885 [Phylliscum demangeonii]|nr:MAG: hypothetical protein M1826_000885 [Phylliscum demangeonii]